MNSVAARTVKIVVALALLFGSALCASVRGEVDFTPISSTYQVEGATFANVTFRIHDRKVTFTPPSGWELKGGKELSLTPPNAPQSKGTIRIEPLKEGVTLDDGAVEEHVKAMQSELPASATDVEVASVIRNPIRINGFETVQITLGYKLFEQTFRTQALFMVVRSDLWRIEFTTRAFQFEKAYEPLRLSLYSIEGL